MKKTSLFPHLTPCFCSLLETSQEQDSVSVWLSFGKNVRGIENLIVWVQGPQWGKNGQKNWQVSWAGVWGGTRVVPFPPTSPRLFLLFHPVFCEQEALFASELHIKWTPCLKQTNVCFKCFIPYNFLVKQTCIQWSLLSSGHQQRSRGSLGFTFCRD